MDAPRPVEPDRLTDDSVDILAFAADALDAGVPAALVTLIGIEGGGARAPGAHMAVRGDGRYCGFVSGGCTEAAIAANALEAIALGTDRQVRYGQGSPYFDIVLPCGGGIVLAIHVLRAATPLRSVLAAVAARRPAGLRYDFARQSLAFVPDAVTTGPGDGVFETGYRPAVRLVIHGRSIELAATRVLAAAAGYEAVAWEDGTPIDADSAVVLLEHDLERELPALRAALAAEPFYIGALGSRRTHRSRVQALGELGYSAADIGRIKAPIGIFPRARDARSLALSVLADVAAVRSGSQ